MNFDTNANLQDRDCIGTAIRIDNEPLLIERLQAFGLIESNGKGGWQLTRVLRSRPGDVRRARHGCVAKNRRRPSFVRGSRAPSVRSDIR